MIILALWWINYEHTHTQTLMPVHWWNSWVTLAMLAVKKIVWCKSDLWPVLSCLIHLSPVVSNHLTNPAVILTGPCRTSWKHAPLRHCSTLWLAGFISRVNNTVAPAVQSQFCISMWHSVLDRAELCPRPTQDDGSTPAKSWRQSRAEKALWIKVPRHTHPGAVYTAGQQHPVQLHLHHGSNSGELRLGSDVQLEYSCGVKDSGCHLIGGPSVPSRCLRARVQILRYNGKERLRHDRWAKSTANISWRSLLCRRTSAVLARILPDFTPPPLLLTVMLVTLADSSRDNSCCRELST